MPYRTNPVANAPNKKYFNADSLDLTSFLFKPASTYNERERISNPKKIVTRLVLPAIKSIPDVAKSIRQ